MNQPEHQVYAPFPSFAGWFENGFDAGSFERFVRFLEEAKAAAGPDALRRAVETATRWAAIDTGAIEGLYEVDRGFTFSVAVEAAAWDNIHLVKGEKVRRAIEDAVHGYEYVLDLATGAREVSEVWLKELHAVLCASQDTYTVVTAVGTQERELPKGQYKTEPNSPLKLSTGLVHAYAPVADTSAEMARLVENCEAQRSSRRIL